MTIKGTRVALAAAGSLAIPALVSLIALDEQAMPAGSPEAEASARTSVVEPPVPSAAAFTGGALTSVAATDITDDRIAGDQSAVAGNPGRSQAGTVGG